MSSKPFATADTIVEQMNSGTAEENENGYGIHSGMNLLLQSAFLRMTLVGTSTVVAVSSIAFLTIGTCELLNTESHKGNEALVLVAGGVILLVASFFQFVTVGLWSGWCTVWPAARRCEREIHLLPSNQFFINGQMVNVKRPKSGAEITHSSGFDVYESNLQMIPEEGDGLAPTVLTRGNRRHHDTVPILEVDSVKVDATTSTRGEMIYFPIRGYAPLALQEEITPSLRSSFQSFDELA